MEKHCSDEYYWLNLLSDLGSENKLLERVDDLSIKNYANTGSENLFNDVADYYVQNTQFVNDQDKRLIEGDLGNGGLEYLYSQTSDISESDRIEYQPPMFSENQPDLIHLSSPYFSSLLGLSLPQPPTSDNSNSSNIHNNLSNWNEYDSWSDIDLKGNERERNFQFVLLNENDDHLLRETNTFLLEAKNYQAIFETSESMNDGDHFEKTYISGNEQSSPTTTLNQVSKNKDINKLEIEVEQTSKKSITITQALYEKLQVVNVKKNLSTAASNTYNLLQSHQAVLMKVPTVITSNILMASFVGCIRESAYFVSDRAKLLSFQYLYSITADDPERMHLEKIRTSSSWSHIFLRYSMASLSWKKRQLLHETSDHVVELALKTMTATHPSKSSKNISNGNKLIQASGHYETETVSCRKDETKQVIVPDQKVIDANESTTYIQSNVHDWIMKEAEFSDDDELQYALAKYFTAPHFEESQECFTCNRSFGVTLFRHHCRYCGKSFCDEHSMERRCIYRYGIVHPVRVCAPCRFQIDETYRQDELIWKNHRIDGFLKNKLIPYFNTEVDTGVDKALRIADCSLVVVKNTITLNFPTKVVLETIHILKRYGLSGFAGLLLRKDFMESVETLKRISGIDKMFSMTLHELTACIYYKLAIERGLRGCSPDGEAIAHEYHVPAKIEDLMNMEAYPSADENEENYECRDATDSDVNEAIKYAAIALKIIYEEDPVDCQRLAKSMGYDLIFTNADAVRAPEQPCFGLFAATTDNDSKLRNHRKEAILAIRGTQTIQDVVTDIRSAPQLFPPNIDVIISALTGAPTVPDVAKPKMRSENVATQNDAQSQRKDGRDHNMNLSPDVYGLSKVNGSTGENFHDQAKNLYSACVSDQKNNDPSVNGSPNWEWLNVLSTNSTYACGGMARSALNVLKEVGPALVRLHLEGYSIVLVGHSLGGAVAALITYMLHVAVGKSMPVKCITYGCPSCVDAKISDALQPIVLNVVIRDDVISRITPHSIRLLMKELTVFRQQVFKHIQQDWLDVIKRAASLWSPRWRKTHANSQTHNMQSKDESSPKQKDLQHVPSLNADTTTPPTSSDGLSSYLQYYSSTLPNYVWPTNTSATDNGSIIGNMSNTSLQSSVLVEEERLPELWLPGRIVHVYIQRGQRKAAQVSRNFPELRKIEIQGNIFRDHTSRAIFDSLLEVRAVRSLQRNPFAKPLPTWIPYDASDMCHCCLNSFTWHSTFRGEAQEYRERYNCRFCGGLVCGPCSSQKRTMPSLGFLFPRRICDHCLNTGDFAIP